MTTIEQAEQAIDAAILKAGKAVQQQYRHIVTALEQASDPVQQADASRRFIEAMNRGGALGRVLQAHHVWSQLATEQETTATLPFAPAVDALQLAHDTATDEEYNRYLTACQALLDTPKWSSAYRKVLRRIHITIASENGVGRLLAAHLALSDYGQIAPIIPRDCVT